MSTVKLEIDDLKLWHAITGSDFAFTESFLLGLLSDVDYDNPTPLKVAYLDKTLETRKYKTLSSRMLANAYGKALQDGIAHCGHYSLNPEDSDACFAYLVLQYAIYGEVVFG